MPAPPLPEIVRQHAEQAAFLWTVYDYHLLHPDENPDMDEDRLSRLVRLLDAHIDGLRIAGKYGLEVAQALFEEFREPGELFVIRMLQPSAQEISVEDLDLDRVRAFLTSTLENSQARA